MNCLKCGKEVDRSQVFCDDCLQVMDSYPVAPGTPIQILQRAPLTEKPSRRKSDRYADSIRSLRRVIRWLCIALAALTLIICVLCGLLYHTMNSAPKESTIGKNYTTIETDTQP